MPSKKRKNNKLKKVLIQGLKWISAIAPVCVFIYILYYYKQLDFFKKEQTVKTATVVIGKDSTSSKVKTGDAVTDDQIKILENEWHFVGGVAIHNLLIDNKTDRRVRNIEVEFKYLSDTQEVVASKVLKINSELPAKKSTKVSNLSAGFVSKGVVGCDIKVIGIEFMK